MSYHRLPQRDHELLERLRIYVQATPPAVLPAEWRLPVHTYALQARYPPVSEDRIQQAEAHLGFRLPPLLRLLYKHIANGGFGPGYGLPPLDMRDYSPQESLVQWYMRMVEADYPEGMAPWPNRYLQICDWGCAISSHILWAEPNSAVYCFDGNTHHIEYAWEETMVIEAPSLADWLDNWLSCHELKK